MSTLESRAADWLRAWDSQGLHRTGTEGDHRGADWLAQQAEALGAPVEIEPFTLSRVDPVAAYLEFDGERLAGVPVFDAPSSGPDGVAGALGPVGSGAPIAVAELSPWTVYSDSYRNSRRAGAHRGLAVVCQGTQPGLALLNAEDFREPYGAPAVQLDSSVRDRVLVAAARGVPVRLVSHSLRTPAEARNVVVALPGRDASLRPVVVMTPRSSWWQSTSERGGGLVCWLETLRALLADPPAAPVILTYNSGHELGHLGLDEFCARRSGWESVDGAVWVHYGANIGAAGGKLSVMSADDQLRALTADNLAQAGHAPDVMAPKTQVPSGETRDIHRAGGRYVTLVGSNPLFHMPQDRWPHAVDVPAIARIAAGATRMVAALVGSGR
jgi:hypothetical protein